MRLELNEFWDVKHVFCPFQFQDEVEKCKATYEALNSQLIEELPTLIEVATSIFLAVISEFILARKLFVGRITKELLTLMDVSTHSSQSYQIHYTFLYCSLSLTDLQTKGNNHKWFSFACYPKCSNFIFANILYHLLRKQALCNT